MSTSELNKRIVIIAGPNGAGKTTFAREFLPTDAELPNFVNADLIAAGLSPFAPELAAFKAGRLMLETIADYARRNNRGHNNRGQTTVCTTLKRLGIFKTVVCP